MDKKRLFYKGIKRNEVLLVLDKSVKTIFEMTKTQYKSTSN